LDEQEASAVEQRTGIACIVVRDHASQPVLLLRRAFGEFDGEWCFVAGTPHADEPPERAVRRELHEETGLRAGSLSALCVSTAVAGLALHVFLARCPTANRIRLDSEHSEWRWASFDDAMESLSLPSQRRMLELAAGVAA